MKGADYVFTGEGEVDHQIVLGKTPFGVSTVAKKLNIRTIPFAGRIGEGTENLYEYGVTPIVGILPGIASLEEALKDGAKNIERISENIARILKL